MEFEPPVSPTGQYFNSSAMSISILAVLEFEAPIDDSQFLSLFTRVFLPVNPRFSSIMVVDEKDTKKWKRVEVKMEDHIKVPRFPAGMSPEFYDSCFDDYLSTIALEQLPPSRPLWEIHVIKYATSNAAGNLVFKLHHSLGDGYSLMGTLFTCFQRSDNPSLPLTFPCHQSNSQFRPITVTTLTFSLDRLKEIKAKLGVTINDMIVGIVFLGTRLYMQMQAKSQEQENATSTALMVLNTRAASGSYNYRTVSEMVRPNAEMPWGNHFTFLHVAIPRLTSVDLSKPTSFVMQAHRLIRRKRNSAAVLLTGWLLEKLRKFGGPEGISIKMMSYVGKLRVAMRMEKGFMDPHKFRSCIDHAFHMIHKAAN